ncbi:MAG: cytochrome c oxidase subunit II [Streptomycetaceae bacterium]|jgi:cytochrome c oxidase subunit 2|nr:MAG: cytochrome c oxidase subunit II [Streptomycetaceae bacterium]
MSQTQTQDKAPWWKRKDVKETATLWVILSVLIGGLAGEVIARSMGAPASETMENTIRMMKIFTWVSAPVAGLVGAIALKSLLQKRHYGDTPPAESDHEIANSPKASAVWIVTSGLLCLFALVFGMIVMQEDAKSLQAPNAIHVNVTGQQWLWNFDYPDNAGVRSHDLYLPVDRPVIFNVSAKDVKHSFWIVQMGVKVDANPGYITQTAVTPNKIGVFDVRCAELCGLLHAYMQSQVHVVSQADYDAWIKSQGGRA